MTRALRAPAADALQSLCFPAIGLRLAGNGMEARRLESLVRDAIPGAEVEAIDLQGGDHFELTVISDRFETASLVARHRMIYAALGEAMQAAIHAVTIRALTPAELASERAAVVEIQRS